MQAGRLGNFFLPTDGFSISWIASWWSSRGNSNIGWMFALRHFYGPTSTDSKTKYQEPFSVIALEQMANLEKVQ